MGKHTTTQIIFSPRGGYASDAIKTENIHLAISLDDVSDSFLYGPGIDASVRQHRLEEIIIKQHGKEILDTHGAWQITVSHDVWNNGNPKPQSTWHASCINNPAYRDNHKNSLKTTNNDDDWRREQAMMNGMAFGTQGYNDMM